MITSVLDTSLQRTRCGIRNYAQYIRLHIYFRVNFKNNHHVSRICKNSQNPVSNFKNSHIAKREFNDTKKLNKSLKLMYYPLVSPIILLRRPLARPFRMSHGTAQSALLNTPDNSPPTLPALFFGICPLLSRSAWLTMDSGG